MSAITINGDLIHYEKLGRGRPVILIHGWLGSWRYWIPLMQQLHLKYSVYTLDLLGFGDSAKNATRYTVEYQAQMLDKFMEQLGITKAAFVGHGLGGMVITEFALNHTDKVARMMLSSLPLFDTGDLNERVPAGQSVLLTGKRDRFSLAPNLDDDTVPSVRHADEGKSFNELPTIGRIDPLDRQRLMQRAKQIEERQRSEIAEAVRPTPTRNPLQDTFGNRTLVDLLDKCFKRTDPIYDKMKPDVDKADNQVLAQTTNQFDAGSLLDKLRRLSQPVLMLHGVDDPLLPQPNDDILQYLTLNRDELFVPIKLEGAKHFPMLELEAFPRLANDFLEAVDITKIEVRGRWRRPYR